MGYIILNGSMIVVKDKVGTVWKGTFVAYLKALYLDLPGGSEKNMKNPKSIVSLQARNQICDLVNMKQEF
jgi:hypothetical protein